MSALPMSTIPGMEEENWFTKASPILLGLGAGLISGNPGQGLLGGLQFMRQNEDSRIRRGLLGIQTAEAQRKLQQAQQLAENWSKYVASLPEDQQTIYGTLTPEKGVEALAKGLETEQTEKIKTRYEPERARAMIPIEAEKAATLAPIDVGKALAIDKGTLPGRLQVAATGKPVQSVSVNTAQNPFFAGLGGGLSKQLLESKEAADSAATALDAVGNAKEMLGRGIFSGTGAEFQLGVARALKKAGIYNDERVENTEVFMSQMAKQVVANVKALGSNASNADRDYAERAAGGKIDMSDAGLRRLADVTERTTKQVIARHNMMVAPIVASPNTPPELKHMLSVQPRERTPVVPEEAAPSAAPVAAGGPKQVKSKIEYDALPKGTPYLAPDGSMRIKQ